MTSAAERLGIELKRARFQTRGEWFAITDDQVKWIIDELFFDGLVTL